MNWQHCWTPPAEGGRAKAAFSNALAASTVYRQCVLIQLFPAGRY